jgi:hypothetical protein
LVFSKRDKDVNPYLVTAATFAGAIAGKFVSMILNLLLSLIGINLSNIDYVSPLVEIFIALVFAYIGAYFAAGIQYRLPSFRKRLVATSIGLILIILPFYGSLAISGSFNSRSNFPAKGTMEERHQWALSQFPNYYMKAVEAVIASNEIKNDVGENILVAPAVNSNNYFTLAPGDPGIAVFTLDVKGDKGKGVCRISLSKNTGEVVNGQKSIGVSDFNWSADK